MLYVNIYIYLLILNPQNRANNGLNIKKLTLQRFQFNLYKLLPFHCFRFLDFF